MGLKNKANQNITVGNKHKQMRTHFDLKLILLDKLTLYH